MTDRVPRRGLDAQGIATGAEIFWNLTTAPLVEHAVRRGEGLLAKDGPLVVETGKHTGRSAKDKFIVRDAATENTIWWDNDQQADGRPTHSPRSRPISSPRSPTRTSCTSRTCIGGSQPEHRVNVRVINELAWHNLFIRTLLVRPEADELRGLRARISRSSTCRASAPIPSATAAAARR